VVVDRQDLTDDLNLDEDRGAAAHELTEGKQLPTQANYI
jgi:hypothetical protein